MRQYINAVQAARISTADVNYNENTLLTQLRLEEQKKQTRSLGNASLSLFTQLYPERVEQLDEYSGRQCAILLIFILFKKNIYYITYLGTDMKLVYSALQRLRQMALRVDLTLKRHAFALEKMRDDIMSTSTSITDFDNIPN